MSLAGQVALVTGGSRGIGRATALELARLGAHVVINYRSNEAAAEQTLAALIAEGQGLGELCRFDVADENQVDGAIKIIVDRHQKLDILVNNAAITADNLLIRMKSDEWDRVAGINLKGTIVCSRAAIRAMLRQRYGRIINVSSVAGQMGNAGQSLYAATKAGVLGFTKAIAREVASRGITVNAVAPGFIETEMTAELPATRREEYVHAIPLARFGTSEEVAASIAFLAGPRAGYITGQVIGVNGGIYM